MKIPKLEKSSIDLLREEIASELDQVNILILDQAKSNAADIIPEITSYIANSGGKRIRAILTLAAARMFDIKTNHHILLAAAIEYIHTATLLHDDVVDESKLRRGKPTANNVFGNKASILVGDYLFAQSFQLMVKTGYIEALDILSKAASIISEGEVMQLTNIGNIETSEDRYYRIVASKTASLFAAALEVGALVAGANKRDCSSLREYGTNLGMVFQIVDDLIDYLGNDIEAGKSIGNDFREGKITLPIILFIQVAKADDKNKLFKLLQGPKDNYTFLEAKSIIENYDGFELCKQKARNFAHLGAKSISQIQSPICSILHSLIYELLQRTH